MLELLPKAEWTPEQRYHAGLELFRSHSIDDLDEAVAGQAADPEDFDHIYPVWVAFLTEWNYFNHAIRWHEAAVRNGHNPYDVSSLVASVWERRGNSAALAVCEAIDPVLDQTSYRIHGDRFHVEKAREAVAGFKRVIAYENGADTHPGEVAENLHDAPRGAIWERCWQLLRIAEHDRVARMAALYPYIYGNDPGPTLDAVEAFLAPDKRWAAIAELVDAAREKGELGRGAAMRLLHWQQIAFEALEEAGRAGQVEAESASLLAAEGTAEDDPHRLSLAALRLWHRYRESGGADLTYLEGLRAEATMLLERLGDGQPRSVASADLTMLIAHLYEDLGDHGKALEAYLEVAGCDPGGYLPEPYWRACSFLAGAGCWRQAADIQGAGARANWLNYQTPARLPPAERYSSGMMLPKRAVMLNTNGIGDDLWRVFMLRQLLRGDLDYACVVDERLVDLLKRSVPGIEFIVRSRTTGVNRVTARQFHDDREGLYRSIESTMTSTEIMRKIEDYGEIVISEDVFAAYFNAGGKLPDEAPAFRLTADADMTAKARDWLAGLPAGRINVGLSWRSGRIHRNHYSIEELGPLLTLPGINWVVLQYLVSEEEIASARNRFGVHLHLMPGVDLMNDIDQVMALGACMDIMLATPSTIEPLVALTGTPTMSLAAGYDSVSQYRISDDGETDRMLPNLTHISQRRYGDRQGIVEEAARRLAAFAQSGLTA
jgi:hypothetical protein